MFYNQNSSSKSINMKYLYLFLSFLLMTNIANTQSFTTQGNNWVQNGEFLSGGSYPIFYFVEGDTLIGDKAYAKVYFNTHPSFGLVDTAYYAAIRQSSDSIFIIDSDAPAADERLIYAWNSFEIDTTEITTYPAVRLETIDTITLFNGEQHRRFSYTSYHENQFDTMHNYRVIIEDIGNIGETIFNRDFENTPEISLPYGLRCFSRNGELLWKNPMYEVDCTSLIVATETIIEETPFKLFPNPAYDVVYLEWVDHGNRAGYLNVYSSTGALVYTQNLNQQKLEISTRNWTKGLYFIQFISENGQQLVRQLVKLE